MNFASAFTPDKLDEAWKVISSTFLGSLWETVYATLLSTLFAIILGLPLGMILVAGEKDGVLPLPGMLMKILNVIINLLRSVPFIILMVMVIPLTRAIIGTSVGTVASIVPLTIAAFPFVARLVEGSAREVDRGILEASVSMGASTWQIIIKVILPECKPSLINGATVATTTILGYSAMAGIVGAGGLGSIAINYGYYRRVPVTMWVSVIILVLLVQVIQEAGNRIANRTDKRIR